MRSRWFKTPLTKEVWKPQCCLALLRPSMFLPSQAVLGSAKSVSRMQENFATLHAKPWQTSFGFTGCFLRWMNFGKSWTCRMNMQQFKLWWSSRAKSRSPTSAIYMWQWYFRLRGCKNCKGLLVTQEFDRNPTEIPQESIQLHKKNAGT